MSGQNYNWYFDSSGGNWTDPNNWYAIVDGTLEHPAGPPSGIDTAQLATDASITGNGAANLVLVAANIHYDSILDVVDLQITGAPGAPAMAGWVQFGGALIAHDAITVGAGQNLIATNTATVGLAPSAGVTSFDDFGNALIGGGSTLEATRIYVYGTLDIVGSTLSAVDFKVASYSDPFTTEDGAVSLSNSTITSTGAIVGVTGTGNASATLNAGHWDTEQMLVYAGISQTLIVNGGATLAISGGFQDSAQAPEALLVGGPRFVNPGFSTVMATGNATLDISGAGTAVKVTGDARVGDGGHGTVSISGGSLLDMSGALAVGLVQDTLTGTGIVVLGGGQPLHVGGAATIGVGGVGSLEIDAGNTANIDGALDLGMVAGGRGTVSVVGGAAYLHVVGSATIGDAGTGLLSLANGGSLNLGATVDIAVGPSATGTLDMQGNAQIGGDAYFGGAGLATIGIGNGHTLAIAGALDAGVLLSGGATISVGTSHALLKVTGAGTIGDGGDARLSIGGGGSVSTGGVLVLGALGTGAGTIAVDGGSLDVGTDATIGAAGSAELSVTADGTLTVSGALRIAATGGSATLQASGAGTVVQIGGDALIGDGGTASATLAAQASLAVTGSLALGIAAAGHGAVTLDSGTAGVTGAMSLGVAGGGDLTLGAAATLSVTGDVTEGVLASGAGTLVANSASASLQFLADWSIGVAGAHTDLLSAVTSASVAGAVSLGVNAGSHGRLTLDTGASLSVGHTLSIGGAGAGAVSLADTATLSVIGAVTLGAAKGGDGTMALSGSAAFIPGADVTIGNAGNGALTLGTGTTMHLAGALTLGETKGGSGTLSLGGGVTLAPGGAIVVGNAGAATVTVEAGARLDGSAGSFILAESAGSSATITLAGAGAEIAAQDLVVGGGGTGVVDMAGGGSLDAGGSLTLGRDAGGGGTISVGAGAALSVGGALVVGGNGAASLAVNDGSLSLAGGAFEIGLGKGGNGDVSFAQATLSVGALTVGDAGSGSFSASKAAALSASVLVLGAQAGGSGSFNLDGHGASVTAGALTIGDGGTGGVQVTNGGVLQVSGVATMAASALSLVQDAATIESGARWIVGSALEVGEAASAAVTLDTGGQLAAPTVDVGVQAGASGTISLLDPGTALSATLLRLGVLGKGLLMLGTGTVVKAETVDLSGTGTIDGAGTVEGGITDAGTIIADAGTLALTGHVTGTGTATVTSGAELWLGAGAAGVHIDFAASGATLRIGAPTAMIATIDGFGAGNSIVVDGVVADSASYDGALLILRNAGTFVVSYALAGVAAGTLFHAAGGGGGTVVTSAPCFAAGTRIETSGGAVAVEALRVGDHVMLARGGFAPVAWLGHRHVAFACHPRPGEVLPVRVRAHAFAPGVPARDVILSPDHAILVDDALIPVRHLLNGASVAQETWDEVTYWHVELAAHDILLADGLPCESYLDTGNRTAFANAACAPQAYPAFARAPEVREARACLTLVTSGEALDVARRTLRDRLSLLGFAVTHDAGQACFRPTPPAAGVARRAAGRR